MFSRFYFSHPKVSSPRAQRDTLATAFINKSAQSQDLHLAEELAKWRAFFMENGQMMRNTHLEISLLIREKKLIICSPLTVFSLTSTHFHTVDFCTENEHPTSCSVSLYNQ